MRYQTVHIDAFGYELAPNVITSEELEERLAPLYTRLNLRRGQLQALTGIRERRFWDSGEPMYTGALKAGKKALAASCLSPSDIGMIVYCGVCRDNLEPATACAVADGLGLDSRTIIYDISNACLGVMTGMIEVANAIELGQIQAGMVVSCESARQIVDLTIDRMNRECDMESFKRSMAVLTGGSGAVALTMTGSQAPAAEYRRHRLLGGVVRNASRHHRLCIWGPDTGAASQFYKMETDAVGVLKNGVVLGTETFAAFRQELGFSDNRPDKVICHQVGEANQRSILKAIGVAPEKDFPTYPYLANMGTVSLPMTAAIADERGFLEPGDLVGFLGIGSGLNCLMLGVEW
ncbi:MAG: 3-oxoacyl-ACP synthase III [Thermodesulfobacteriota bacterium]|nr:3-oxoacyl-ACP synthase III [Thermodesulfobacteriota bacterium]